MAVSEQRVRIAECDACGNKLYGEGNEVITGAHGRITIIDRAGSESLAEYFSCRTDAGHLGKAAAAAIAKISETPTPSNPHNVLNYNRVDGRG